jgi:aerobic carbon-monoxide dehydrogenase large subunit
MAVTEPWIGRSPRRREDPPLIRGEGRYSADANPPGTLHLAIRRAGLPHATGLRVELETARSMPGVAGAWKAGELGLADDFMPDAGQPPPIRRPVVAFDTVRFEGDAVAVVAAETEYQAQDAADVLVVDMDAARPIPERTGSQRFDSGGAAAAFDGVHVTVKHRLKMARVCGAAVEPRAVLAEWHDEAKTLTIRASVGGVHVLRDALCRCLGLERHQVIAISEDVGGSFGAKNHPYPEYVIAAAVSRLMKRPAKWVAGRSEDGQTTGQSHAAELDLEIAADEDGRLRGLRGKVSWQIGAYLGRGAMQDGSIATHMLSAYRLPSIDIEVDQSYSHTPPAAFIRGGGRPVGNFGIERMIDRLARRLGMDPIELRRRNLVTPDQMPFRTALENVVFDGGDYPRLLELAVARIDVAGIRAKQRSGVPVGVGVALCTESTGIGMAEPSRVAILADGTARVYIGSTPQGQGHVTFVAQVVADRLGWPIERVEVKAGDSRDVPFAMVTAGSRSALEVGNSVALSATSARRLLLERASERLEASVEDLVVGIEGVGVRGVPERMASLATLVGEGLEAAETWDSKFRPSWASSCHAACVQIDPDTGGVDVLRYVIAHDSGRPINPMMVEGQLQGGYAHGLGYALFEEAIHSLDGNFLSASFLDYTIVSAPELRAEPELIHTQTATSHNPESIRGVGEAGTIAVPAAIANAVEDALYAMGREVCVDEVPITPMRLWGLMQA